MANDIIIGADSETDPIARGLLAPPIVCYQWADGEAVAIETDRAYERVREHLESEATIVGQNFAFDLAVYAEAWPDLIPLIFAKMDRDEIADTMIAQQLIDIASGRFESQRKRKGGYSLETTARRYDMEKDGSDPWRVRYNELRGIPVSAWPPEAVHYAEQDAIVVRSVFLRQLESAKYLGDLYFQTRAAFALHLASCWGVYTDPIKVRALHEEIEQIIAEAKTVLATQGLVRADGTRDTKQAKYRAWKAYTDQGLEPKWTKKGYEKDPGLRTWEDTSTDKDSCTLTGDPVLIAYAKYTTQNVLRTRVETLAQGHDLPLQTRFYALLETGRSSSQKPGPPLVGEQMQNPPRKGSYRECFVPRPGYVFVIADYSSAELHTFAQTCLDLFGESQLARDLLTGVDRHLKLGAESIGITYESALERYKAEDPIITEARQRAKAANFGFPGGMGVDKFILYSRAGFEIDFTRAQAVEIKQAWFRTTPEAAWYFRYVNDLLAGRDHTQIKRLREDFYRGHVRYCEICNDGFQGPAAKGTKRALWAVTRACYSDIESPLFGSRVWNCVHDEIMLESPEERAPEAAVELSKIMEREFNVMVPNVPTTAEPYLARYWSKKAKPLYGADGRLIPWPNG